jgi:cytochrome c oxidase subunit 3
MAALGLFFVILGASQWVNGHDWGRYALFFGLFLWLFVLVPVVQ